VASREEQPIVFGDDIEREPEVAPAREKRIGLDGFMGIATLRLACVDEAMPDLDATRLRVCGRECGDFVVVFRHAHGIGKRGDGDPERIEHARREALDEILAKDTIGKRRANLVDRTRQKTYTGEFLAWRSRRRLREIEGLHVTRSHTSA
jgi:hypothetical protein